MHTESNPAAPQHNAGTLPLVAGLLLIDSLHFVFAKALQAYLPAVVAALYVLVVANVEFGLFLILSGRLQPAVLRDHWRFFVLLGFLVGAATSFSYLAVSFVDPGTASFLAQTTTVFAIGLSLFWLREPLSRPELFGAGITLLGAFVIGFQPDLQIRWGAAVTLVGVFVYAVHAAVVKRHGGSMDFANFFFFRIFFTMLFLVVFAAGYSGLRLPPAAAWPLLLLAGTVDVIVSRVLYYLALRRLQLNIHALVLTLSPVITILWSWIFFDAVPTAQGFAGGLVVVGGILIVSRGRMKRVAAVA